MQSVEQLPFGESAFPLSGYECSRNALYSSLDTVGAGKGPVALHLSLGAERAGKDALRSSRSRCRLCFHGGVMQHVRCCTQSQDILEASGPRVCFGDYQCPTVDVIRTSPCYNTAPAWCLYSIFNSWECTMPRTPHNNDQCQCREGGSVQGTSACSWQARGALSNTAQTRG